MHLFFRKHILHFSNPPLRVWLMLCLSLWLGKLSAQAPNDDCANAEVIAIPQNGFGYGTFSSDTVSLAGATSELGETFPAGVPNGKSLWYRFSLPTTREVRILLDQTGNMPVNSAGWRLYATDACIPAQVDAIDPPIFNIEGFTHACLRKGDYLIQLGANLSANGDIFFQLIVEPPSAPEIDYDFCDKAYDFQVISGTSPRNTSYEVGCQSYFEGEKLCPDSSYTKTTWHVFTTDNHVDYTRFEVLENPFDNNNITTRNFGYTLYEGDVRLDSTGLTVIDTCNTLSQISQYNFEAAFYPCLLKPNTTYSVQLLFPTDYFGRIDVNMHEIGGNLTLGPDPMNLPASHQLGTLSFGTIHQVTDFFACNSLTKDYACPPIIEDSIYLYNNATPYDMNWWVTFDLANQTDVEFWIDLAYSQPNPVIRVFQGSAADSCNLSLVTEIRGRTEIPCLEAGTYSVQILGQINSPSWPAYRTNLGTSSRLNIELSAISLNNFKLHTPTAYDSVNNLNPLQVGNIYGTTPNPFDCDQTVMPPGDSCHFTYYSYNRNDRAIYRIIEIGQDGIMTVGGGNWRYLRYKVFQGDASTSPVVNGILTSLVDLACCQSARFPFKVCVSPGRYTLVTYGDVTDINRVDQPWVSFDTFPPSQFTVPTMPDVMDTLGLTNGLFTIHSTPSYFTCDFDNPMTIMGYAPCGGATKQMYHEFYLADSASISFTDLTNQFYYGGGVTHRMFKGRLSTNSLTGLERDCFGGFTMSSCDFMAPGWYTVVSYHTGGTYANPAYCSGTGAGIGDQNFFRIGINAPYEPPRFNTFAKAEQVNGGNPLTWYQQQGHTDTIPYHDTTYTLGTEYFDCEDDLPFPAGIVACNTSFNRVSYRVFTLAKPSLVYIMSGIPWPYNGQNRIYQGDITALTPPFTIEHDCFTQYAMMCLPAGTYTMVSFASDQHIGRSQTPRIYLDSLGTSKYDHARDAYNYGNLPRDSVEYFAAVGAPTDALGRPASNDFIFCSTTAQATDPSDVCLHGSTTLPYTNPWPVNPRQNLWYTFELTGPGSVDVSVYGLTPSKESTMPFSVYKVTNNVYPLTDSTDLELEFVVNNQNYWCWSHHQSVNIFRDPCAGITTDRYVVIVDREEYNNATGSHRPNMQVQVGIRFSDIPGTSVLYDHISQANLISGNPTTTCAPPYNATPIGAGGTFTGCEGNLTCATQDVTDQNSCGAKTIWYRLDLEGSGRIRLNYTRTDQIPSLTGYDANDIQLYEQVVPGDSTTSGLRHIPLTQVYADNPAANGPQFWGQSCYTTGTYFIMITGCNFPNATVYPTVWLEDFPGDYCQDSLQMTVDTTGFFQVSGRVDCWTIGEGPGEIDSLSMGCLGVPSGLKSGWFHVSITDTNKMDLDINLTENTSATSLEVRYRVANGSCNSMTFENCVDDGVFIVLNLKCRQDSGLWIHVVVPEGDTGTVTLNVTATPSTDQSCEPLDPFAPVANFNFTPGCVGELIPFTNQSTVGNNLSYLWDFGDGFTSTFQNPAHVFYTPDTFLVKLVVSDTASADTSERLIFIYPNPDVSFSPSASPITAGNPVVFNNTTTSTLSTATYYWDFCAGGGFCSADMRTFSGEVPPPITYNVPGKYLVCLTVTNGNCDSTFCDSIEVKFVNFFGGGPYDGFDQDDTVNCPTVNFFTGGPYDGFDWDDTSNCPTVNFFTGGPYDGFDWDDTSNCPTVNFFAGGPYDGFDWDDTSNCPTVNFFTGGPYDGFDWDDTSNCPMPNFFAGGPYDGFDWDDTSNCPMPNFFAGGPYDGADMELDPNACRDTMASPFSGGPYDGAGLTESLLDCPITSVWAGGPFDGAGDALITGNCATINFFAGGPYDGFHVDDTSNCPPPVNYFTGGPFDGFDLGDTSNCVTVNFFTGGPYDGFDWDDTSNCPTVNYFTGGPYDGFDWDDTSNCPTVNFFTGGPYDGFDWDDTSNCPTANFFTGGPYDGFDMGDTSNCVEVNYFTGGPYDGFDWDGSGGIDPISTTVCQGDTALLVASVATDWYDQPVGGNLLATDTNAYLLPNLNVTTQVYLEDVCAGGTARVPATAHVIDSLDANFTYSTNCYGVASYFASQTLVAGPSTPTIGTEITGLGLNGTSPSLRDMSFSSAGSSSFGSLFDGNTTIRAWQGGNTGAATLWVQWNYFQPWSVDRITWSTYGSNPTQYPTAARLYYSDGGPWVLVKGFSINELNTSQFDSGPICESTNRYARRWKLELDVTSANAPDWSEFQVYANQATSTGNVSWDFGDGSPIATGNNVSHAYTTGGTFTVTMTANAACPCASIATETVMIDTCIILPLLTQYLAGEVVGEKIRLDWEVEGKFVDATLEKYLNGHWIPQAEFVDENQAFYSHIDSEVQYERSNLYRVRVWDGDVVLYSNMVELTLDIQLQDILVYPNPAMEEWTKVRLRLPEQALVEIELLDVLGQTIETSKAVSFKGERSFEFALDDLSEGQYFVRIWIDQVPHVEKLVVMR